MNSLIIWIGKSQRRAATVLAAMLLAGCSTTALISSYDEPTDKALTALQQSSDDFITGLIERAPTNQNAYIKHLEFYQDADQQLRRLEFRVSAIPSNGRTIKLVENIRTVLLGADNCNDTGISLRDLHCNSEAATNGPSKAALRISQRNINQTIGAALALELAKKQGLTPGN